MIVERKKHISAFRVNKLFIGRYPTALSKVLYYIHIGIASIQKDVGKAGAYSRTGAAPPNPRFLSPFSG